MFKWMLFKGECGRYGTCSLNTRETFCPAVDGPTACTWRV